MRIKLEARKGNIHSIHAENYEREITGRGQYAVILASYYGGKGYTTHTTEASAVKQAKKLSKEKYSFEIIDSDGTYYEVNCDSLYKAGAEAAPLV